MSETYKEENMKSYRKELHLRTKTRRAYVNITPQIEAALAESGIQEGLCLVNAMNITDDGRPRQPDRFFSDAWPGPRP
jgi:hypothetical protein